MKTIAIILLSLAVIILITCLVSDYLFENDDDMDWPNSFS